MSETQCKGNDRPVLPWFPFYPEKIQASPRYRGMRDFQQAWYRNLLDNAWCNSENPGFLPNDPDRLWRLANARSKRFFERENTVVMACFQVSTDGRHLFNKRLLGLYEEQLVKFLKSKDHGLEHGQKKTKGRKMTLRNQTLSLSISETVVLEIYKTYPRRTKKLYAIDCIKRAIQKLSESDGIDHETAAERIFESVRLYAKSPAGNAGKFTPHCSTWMNQGQYLDDPKEWERGNGEQQTSSPQIEKLKRSYSTVAAIFETDGDGDVDDGDGEVRKGVNSTGSEIVAGNPRAAAIGSD